MSSALQDGFLSTTQEIPERLYSELNSSLPKRRRAFFSDLSVGDGDSNFLLDETL